MTCECGATLDVPSLGKLGKLERIEVSSEAPHAADAPRPSESSDWDAASAQGFFGVVLIALGLTWLAWLLSHTPAPLPSAVLPEDLRREVETWSPAEVIAELEVLRAGLDREPLPEAARYLSVMRRQRFLIAASGLVAAAGAALLVRAWLARRRSSQPSGENVTPPPVPTA